jgi:hypothetical protein
MMHFYNEQEPDNVNETPSLDFAVAAAISATAHAGSTITDKSYWPSEARPAVHITTGASQQKFRDAFASSTTKADENGNEWRYQGGPKYQSDASWRPMTRYATMVVQRSLIRAGAWSPAHPSRNTYRSRPSPR